GDPEISLIWSRKALDQHRKNNDAMGVGITLANMGRVLQSQGDFTGALAVSTESLTVMSQLNDSSGMARSMIALSELYMEKRHFEQAATFADEALTIFTETHDVDRSLRCLLILSRIALHRKKYDEAVKTLKKARVRSKETDNHPLHIDIEIISAEVARSRKDLATSRKHLNAAMKIAVANNVATSQADIAGALSQLAEATGDLQSALKFERLRATSQRIADDQLRARHGQALQLRLDVERAQRAREATQHQNEHLAFTLESKERELNTSAIAIAQKNELLTAIGADLQVAIDAASTDRGQLLRSLLHRVEGHRRTGEDWKNFTEQLKDVHDHFFRMLAERCPDLTSSEIKMASLLKLNLSSKEIAEILSLTLPTVEVYRHRLRKKLNIPSSMSLTTFFQSLD
ncbi:MAG TPA: tetratricopeptide repeat protein, partial [Candidatus Didemnitutus sp.]|nr:tetratricopeptide repeat protein [Candidatus Didemnitutus sp.]